MFKALVENQRVEVKNARRFSHYIGNYQFWFAYHDSISHHGQVVSEYNSGKKVCDIPYNTIAACLGDKKAAAKMEIDKLVTKFGAPRVQSVLRGA